MAGLVRFKDCSMQPPRVWKENWLCLLIRMELTSAVWLVLWKGTWNITALWDTIVHQVVLVRWEILCKNNPSLALFKRNKTTKTFSHMKYFYRHIQNVNPYFYMHFSWLLRSLPGWEICKNWSLDKVMGCFLPQQVCFVFMWAQSTFITSLTMDVTNRIKYRYPNLTDEGKGLAVTFKGYQILT